MPTVLVLQALVLVCLCFFSGEGRCHKTYGSGDNGLNERGTWSRKSWDDCSDSGFEDLQVHWDYKHKNNDDSDYPWQIWIKGINEGEYRGSKSGTVDLGEEKGVKVEWDCHAGLNYCRGVLNVYQVECAASNCGLGRYRSKVCTNTGDRVCTSCPAHSNVNSSKTGCACTGHWTNSPGKSNMCNICVSGWDINYSCNRCVSTKYGSSCSSTTHCLTAGGHGTCNHQSCYGISGNGQCSSCDYRHAGRICEHNVCSISAAASAVELTWTAGQNPKDFDWTLYKPENIEVTQVKENDGEFGLQTKFRSISSDTTTFVLKIDGNARKTIVGITADCNNVASRAVFDPVPIDKAVGDEVSVCVQANWKASRLHPPTSWGASTFQTSYDRANPVGCVPGMTYKIKYQTHVLIEAFDLLGTVHIKDVAVEYSFQGQRGSPRTTAPTSANGKLDLREPLTGFADGATDSQMTIHAATKVGSLFKVCPHAPPCTEGELQDLPYNFQTTHSNGAARSVYLVDEPSSSPSPTMTPSAAASTRSPVSSADGYESTGYFAQEVLLLSSALSAQGLPSAFERAIESLTPLYGAHARTGGDVDAFATFEDLEIIEGSNCRAQELSDEVSRVRVEYIVKYVSPDVDVSGYPLLFKEYLSSRENRNVLEERLIAEGVPVVPGSSSESLSLSSPAPQQQKDEGNGAAAVVGAVVGAVCGALLLGAFLLILHRRRKNRRNEIPMVTAVAVGDAACGQDRNDIVVEAFAVEDEGVATDPDDSSRRLEGAEVPSSNEVHLTTPPGVKAGLNVVRTERAAFGGEAAERRSAGGERRAKVRTQLRTDEDASLKRQKKGEKEHTSMPSEAIANAAPTPRAQVIKSSTPKGPEIIVDVDRH